MRSCEPLEATHDGSSIASSAPRCPATGCSSRSNAVEDARRGSRPRSRRAAAGRALLDQRHARRPGAAHVVAGSTARSSSAARSRSGTREDPVRQRLGVDEHPVAVEDHEVVGHGPPYPRRRALADEPWELGGVRIPNRVVLAPLAGIGNWFVRLQAKRYGAGLAVSEMVSSFAIHYGNRRTLDELLVIDPREEQAAGRSSIQLFGQDPEIMRSAAAEVAEARRRPDRPQHGLPRPEGVQDGRGRRAAEGPRDRRRGRPRRARGLRAPGDREAARRRASRSRTGSSRRRASPASPSTRARQGPPQGPPGLRPRRAARAGPPGAR